MLDAKTFQTIVELTPLVSVDLVIIRGGCEVLLGLRNNRPAQAYWFVPGGRIAKDERMAAALERVAQKELGLGAALAAGDIPIRAMGAFEHFYDDCFAGDMGVSTHYVTLGYHLAAAPSFALPRADDQHAALRWWPIAEALASPEVHQFSKDYLLALGAAEPVRKS